MANTTIYSSEFIEITKRDDGFYLESFKKGFNQDDFYSIINSHPDIKINNFAVIRETLIFAPQPARKFASVKDRVVVEISNDGLKAFITLTVDEEELKGQEIIKEIVSKLNEAGVVHGIKKEVFMSLYSGKPILIAEGTLPEPGEDSQNRLYQLNEVRPEIKEDGKADHYDLHLINMVQTGDWLGEQTHATPGREGRTVRGTVIPSTPGKTYPLFYDKNTVKEVASENVTTLYALKTGAVFFEGDRIGVSNHLEIKDSIGVKTGNVDFDGYLTVQGSVEDNFSVATTKDIEILGEYGVGNVKEIKSHEGSIYIKGGIAGKGKTKVICKKNLYLKYVADADIVCEGTVHVGFYCINSNITAKEVIIDSMKGQIMGGVINAEIKVVSAIFGSPSEKRTTVSVKGFNRMELKAGFDELAEKIERLKAEINKLKQQISAASNSYAGGQARKEELENLNERYGKLKVALSEMEEQRINISGYIKTKGEGEIAVLKKAFPNTLLEIKKIQKEITAPVLRVSYYYSEGNLKEM